MIFRQYVRSLGKLLYRHRYGLTVLFLCMFVPMLLLEDLVEGVHRRHNWALDEQILYAIRGHASPRKDFLVFWATRLGYWMAIPALLAVVSLLRALNNTAGAAYFVVTVLGAWVMDGAAKLFFGRMRPNLWTSILPESSFSFPSGHSMISVSLAFALVVLLWRTRWRYAALICAGPAVFLVGLSRLYLGVHYPSDVLGGWCAGLIWASGVYLICRRYLREASPEAKP